MSSTGTDPRRFETTEEFLAALYGEWSGDTTAPKKPAHNNQKPPLKKLPEIKKVQVDKHLYSGTPNRGEKFLLIKPHPLAGQVVIYNRREKPEGYYAVLDIFTTDDGRETFITDAVQAVSWIELQKPTSETVCTNPTTR